jgi:uncharacterized membrane protein required for colicin V production
LRPPGRRSAPGAIEGDGVELLAQLNWVDLAIIVALAGGVFAGFTEGAISYLLNALAVVVAFIVAAQLKEPIIGLLGFWTAF